MTKATNNADSSEKDTKQTILDATVELIRENGFGCATLRNIAAKADINLALVNYYFGSKDHLLGAAVRVLVSTFNDAFQVLEDDLLPPRERLKEFFIRYITNLERYPGLAKQMLDQRHVILGSHDEYARYCKMMRIEKILAALQEITGEQDKDQQMTMLFQLYGAMVFPIVMASSLPQDQEGVLPVFKLPEIGDQIDGLFDRFFTKPNHN
ncbi:TetR/AcrR family transcriptional regulator [Paenibacillus tianjinensis]|uniref:TetR/AcrR family transcriptional regulator n=1 Tax=Paenibacillus tianjinensis TaxID=2810347 RepID=A0ABX7LK42_9BACL|nr:TetR/AcrR family transcriptional regulator [Paenibacillus tianjinensis]QSF47263.1 TetR/AcrR family transcriptional regulator [Paenibacillus tianjinensis]